MCTCAACVHVRLHLPMRVCDGGLGIGAGNVASSACARVIEGLGDWESGRASGASDVASSTCVCVALRRSATCRTMRVVSSVCMRVWGCLPVRECDGPLMEGFLGLG